MNCSAMFTKVTGSRSLDFKLLTYCIVSDPMHARYGQYLRLDEVNELSKPSNEAVSLVHEWLLDNGIDDFGSNSARNRINFRIRVDEAAQLLDTTYYIFEHEDGSRLVRTTEWSLPSELHDIINVVQPTTSFMRALPPNNKRSSQPSKRAISNRVVSEDCDTKLTIGCIKDLYGISGYSQTALDNNKIGFVNFIEYSPVVEDIVQYLQNNKEANPAAVDPSTGWSSFSDYVTISQGPGPEHTYTPDAPHDEATADADLILGLTYPMPMRTWSTGGKANSSQFQPDAEYPEVGTNQNEPWSTWLAHIWKEQDLPHVISVSYSDPEDTIPKTMAHEICTDFMTLGGFGVTILASSGNDGLGPSDFCHGSTPKPGTPMFIPHFPASCPWVTTVGATMLVDSKEVAANPAVDIFAPRSGFGFSNYFDRPWWQEDAVGKYLKPLTGDADKYKGWWNPGMLLSRSYLRSVVMAINTLHRWKGIPRRFSHRLKLTYCYEQKC